MKSSTSSLLSHLRLSGIFLSTLALTSIIGLFFVYSSYPSRPPPRPTIIHRQHAFITAPKKDKVDYSATKQDRSIDDFPTKQDRIDDHLASKEYIVDDKCDLFKGHWVPDFTQRSLYNSSTCRTIPDSKNCFKHGRKDVDFLNWRWKPDGCDLPRFNPLRFLRIVRGKKLAFVGDSVARNQMESLLCLLSQVENPVDIYKDSEDRFRTWHFPSSNFTLMILWSKFLLKHEEVLVNGSSTGIYNLHLDKVDEDWASQLQGLNYLIFSDAHWFFRKNYLYNRDKLVGCVFCDEPDIPNKSLTYAIRTAFQTALLYINKCNDCGDFLTLVRTFSPAHFENGAWDTGGTCNRTSPFTEKEANLDGLEREVRTVQVEQLEKAKREANKKRSRRRFGALDVTRAMLMRPDGHPGEFWGNKWMKGYNDCVHWCMPGAIDMWNELLLAVMERDSNS